MRSAPRQRDPRSPFLFDTVERRLLMASIAVTSLADSGTGSLRAAVAAAAATDTIDLTALTGTITLTSQITIDKALTIAGPGAGDLTIDGNNATRLFYVTPAAEASISDLTIANGNSGTSPDGGGAIFAGSRSGNRSGSLSLSRVDLIDNDSNTYGGGVAAFALDLTMVGCTVSGNLVTSPVGQFAHGGGVYSSNAVLVVRDSTFTGNAARIPAVGSSGFAVGGAICVWTTDFGATIENVTVAGNEVRNNQSFALMMGGGVYVGQYSFAISVKHCTIVDNAAIGTWNQYRSGGGLMLDYAGTATVTNNVIARNGAANGPDLWCPEPGNVVAKNNLIGDGAGSGLTNATDGNQLGTTAAAINPQLGALADNGGPVQTMSIVHASPVARAGFAGASVKDSRGVTRSTIAPSIGAFEAPNALPTITSTPTTSPVVGRTWSYLLTATDADGDAMTFSSITTLDWETLTDHGDGTATLSGTTPDTGSLAQYPVTMQVSDGAGVGQQTFVLQSVAVPAIELVAGRVVVRGTSAADDIHVWTRLGGTQVRASRNGVIKNFARSLVTGVRVEGGAGADTILVNADALPADVYGGTGDDTITGGAGDDTLGGGGGQDAIYGMGGRDVLRGHGGLDRLFGGDGDDRLYGGDGRDTLDGGLGADRLWGEAGRDLFRTLDGAIDRLIGGALSDNDRAVADRDDLLVNVGLTLA